jgi:hypothetical protein
MTANLIEDEPQVAAELRAELNGWLAEQVSNG